MLPSLKDKFCFLPPFLWSDLIGTDGGAELYYRKQVERNSSFFKDMRPRKESWKILRARGSRHL